MRQPVQMYVSLVSGRVYHLVKNLQFEVILRREGTDKQLVVPKNKFIIMFTPFDDGYYHEEEEYDEF